MASETFRFFFRLQFQTLVRWVVRSPAGRGGREEGKERTTERGRENRKKGNWLGRVAKEGDGRGSEGWKRGE